MTDRTMNQPDGASRSIAVSARGLSKSFGDTHAVRDLSFDARAGEVTGLLGPNGAGKTTTIKMLTTLLSIDSGTASIVGIDVAQRPDAVRRVIGLAGQSAAVDEKLTARENLELFGRLYKIPSTERAKRIDYLIDRFDLADFADRVAETYSGGQRRRLDVVASLIASPPVLFLDEPTTGLDPHTRTELWGEIRELAEQGDGRGIDHAVPRGGRPALRLDRDHRRRCDEGLRNERRPQAGPRARRARSACRLQRRAASSRRDGRPSRGSCCPQIPRAPGSRSRSPVARVRACRF